jgi:hypothetical protein
MISPKSTATINMRSRCGMAEGKVAAPEDIFAAGGEMGALMRSLT